MRALFGILITAAIALAAGAVGFQAGIASNIGAAGGAVYLGGGIPGLGLLFFLLFVGFLFFAFAGMRRRALGHGPWGGPGHWGPGSDARREWVAEMHRRLHEEEGAADRPAGPSTTA
jgi:hypothetical protein